VEFSLGSGAHSPHRDGCKDRFPSFTVVHGRSRSFTVVHGRSRSFTEVHNSLVFKSSEPCNLHDCSKSLVGAGVKIGVDGWSSERLLTRWLRLSLTGRSRCSRVNNPSSRLRGIAASI
jgi:hypothetical protein